MKRSLNQKGFSLIELLMVVVIIGVLAAVGVPSLSESRDAAEKGATVGTLRAMLGQQMAYMAQHGRYARLSELNTFAQNSLGRTSGTRIYRGNYMFLMSPTPTTTTLRTRYQIIAYKTEGATFVPKFTMEQDGVIDAIVP